MPAKPKLKPIQTKQKTKDKLAQRTAEIVRLLRHYYPNAECALNFETPFQLLIATILSAQCTDERVNIVTAVLFDEYPDAKKLAKADVEDVEMIIRSAGFYKMKAKNITQTAKILVEKYKGEVPQKLELLTPLAGVGRKTANVVLGTAYGIPSGVVVDTHVSRLSYRLGLTKEDNPIAIERDLIDLLPQSDWIDFSHLLIHHGRAICKARKPQCERCFLIDVCPQKFS